MTTLTAPRPVYCVTEHEHRDPAIARDAIAGRFDGPRQASRLAGLFEEALR